MAGRRFLIDTLIVVGAACQRDKYHDYALCVANAARSNNLELYVLPHVVGEAVLVLTDRRRGCYESIGDALSAIDWSLIRLDARLRSYNRAGFARLFYHLASITAGGKTRDAQDSLWDIGEALEIHGVNDILLLIALYADDEIDGLITPESKLLRSPLVGILAEAAGGKAKNIGPAPHTALKECEYRLG